MCNRFTKGAPHLRRASLISRILWLPPSEDALACLAVALVLALGRPRRLGGRRHKARAVNARGAALGQAGALAPLAPRQLPLVPPQLLPCAMQPVLDVAGLCLCRP